MDTNLRTIIERQPCEKHKAEKGAACWWVNSGANGSENRDIYIGICNTRARKAGFVGKINPASMRKK